MASNFDARLASSTPGTWNRRRRLELRLEPSLKRKRFLLLGTAAILLTAVVVLYLLGSVLLTLGISAVLAYVLLPVAKLLERGMPWRHKRPGLARGISVGLIFLFGLSLFAALIIAVVPPTVEQGQRFIENFPTFLNNARTTVEGWVAQYADVVPADLRDQAEGALADAGGIIGAAAWNVVKPDPGDNYRLLCVYPGTGHGAGAGLLPDEGLQPHSRVPARALSVRGTSLPEGHPGHCRPDPGRLHSRAAYAGRNCGRHSGGGPPDNGRPLCGSAGNCGGV